MSQPDPAVLRRVLEKATPLPWTHLHLLLTDDADDALIRAAVNSLPGLLDRIEELEKENARLKEISANETRWVKHWKRRFEESVKANQKLIEERA